MGRKVIFAGVDYHLPDKLVTSAEVQERVFQSTRFQMPRNLVQKVTGIETRHYSDCEQASDLAMNASVKTLEQAGMDPDDIDLLIFASCMQDVAEPATANILQEKLGATRAHVFDIKNACNSFLNGLDVAESLIHAGKARTALIAAGETLSYCINWDIDSVQGLRKGLSGLTLGDAGAAAILKVEPNGNGRGILPSVFQSFGDQWRLATVMGGGSMHRTDEAHAYFTADSQQLRNYALTYIPQFINQTLDRVGWTPDEVDVVCTHQVTMELVEVLAEKTGIAYDKCIISVKDCGNTAAASIPIGLSRALAEGRLKPYAKVLLVGGAAGFSVGVLPVVW